MAKGYYYRRKRYAYKYYKRNLGAKRYMRRYKPLSGMGYNGERFKVEYDINYAPHSYITVPKYTFETGEHSISPVTFLHWSTIFVNIPKMTVLNHVYEHMRVYAVSLQVMPLGDQLDEENLDASACFFGVYFDTVTQGFGYKDVMSLNKHVVVTKQKNQGRVYYGRRSLGQHTGYGTGNYVPFNYKESDNELKIVGYSSGDVDLTSPKYKIIMQFYVECKIPTI